MNRHCGMYVHYLQAANHKVLSILRTLVELCHEAGYFSQSKQLINGHWKSQAEVLPEMNCFLGNTESLYEIMP